MDYHTPSVAADGAAAELNPVAWAAAPLVADGNFTHPDTPAPWAALTPNQRRQSEDDGSRPYTVIGGVAVPLTREDRSDPNAIAAVRDAFAGGVPVEFRLEGLLNLPSTYASRLVCDLAGVVEDVGRAADAGRLFDGLLPLDPGIDDTRLSTLVDALVDVASDQISSDRQAGEFARVIACRAGECGGGDPRYQPSRLLTRLRAEMKRRRDGRPDPPEVGRTPDLSHPSAHHHTPLDYVLGVYKDHLWHDPAGNPYVSVAGGRHLRVESVAWTDWLRREWYAGHFRPPKDDEYRQATAMVAGMARAGPEHPVHGRVARHAGRVYLALANAAGEVVEVGPDGWTISAAAPVRFVPGPDAAPLPTPERGGTLDELRPFVNLTDAGFRAYVAAILDALKGAGDYLVVVVRGEQGAGKSTLVRLAVRLVDPRRGDGPADTSDLPGPPRSEDDLAVTAASYHLVAYDNMSRVTPELSDTFCRLATGGGLVKRKLYSDADLVRLKFCRPVWLNGIPELVRRGDLADRVTSLDAAPPAARTPADRLLARFEVARLRILGALLDVVAGGLAGQAGGPPAGVRLPRMAASGEWVYHCFAHLGWGYEEWRDGVAEVQRGVGEDILGGSALGQALLAWLRVRPREPGPFRRSAQGWVAALEPLSPPDRRPYFPAQPAQLRTQLRELAPGLRGAGVEVSFPEGDAKTPLDGGGRGRAIVVSRIAAGPTRVPDTYMDFI